MGTCMIYQIIIKKPAKKFIDKLPGPDKKRIVTAIRRLPDDGDRKQLRGHPGMYRLRVGPYRIIYTVDHGQLVVYIADTDNRGEIYKRY